MLQLQEIEQLLKVQLQELEKPRVRVAKEIKGNRNAALVITFVLVFFAFWAILALLNVAIFTRTETSLVRWILLAMILLLLGGIRLARGVLERKNKDLANDFKQRVKKEVYEQIFQAWNPSIQYRPKGKMAAMNLKQTQLCPPFNTYRGNDYCKGQVEDGRYFHFSEVLASKRETSPTNGDNKRVAVVQDKVFKGLFFSIEGPHLFNNLYCNSLVVPQKHRKASNKKTIRQKNTHPINDAILDADFFPTPITQKISNTTLFDQLYKIKSPKQWPINRKITNEFKEQLTYMQTALRLKVSLSFQENRVYMLLPQRFNFWTVEVEQSLLQPQRVQALARNFRVTLEALDRLALATRVPAP
jgi:hypothetical protein